MEESQFSKLIAAGPSPVFRSIIIGVYMSNHYLIKLSEQDKEFYVTKIYKAEFPDGDYYKAVPLTEDAERKLIKRLKLKPAYSKRKVLKK